MTKVITYGTWDLFHEGHYRLLQRAKALGDYLIVAVTTETFDKSRGKIGVVDPIVKRIENVKKTGFADEIIVEEYIGQKFDDVQRYNVDIFAIGSDWNGHFDYLKDYCKVVYLERTKDISSTLIRKTQYRVYRIGIIGNSSTVDTFVSEANLVSGANIQNIYDPDIKIAEKFAKKWDLNAYNDLDKFYEATDLIYIASPPHLHYDYIKKTLEHGKHVLCEKPLVLNKWQAEELFSYARKNKLLLFEGIETAYSPGFRKLLGIARSGKIGQIKNLETCFINPHSTRKGVSNLLEMESYAIFPALKLFGVDFESLNFDIVSTNDNSSILIRTTFKFSTGIATATCGTGMSSEQRLLISGNKGYIVALPPWWKTTYFEVHLENPKAEEKYTETFLGDGLRYEINDIISELNGISSTGFKLSEKESIVMADVIEQLNFNLTRFFNKEQ